MKPSEYLASLRKIPACPKCQGSGFTGISIDPDMPIVETLYCGISCSCPAGMAFAANQLMFMEQGEESTWPKR
jgi:hypothetical protein